MNVVRIFFNHAVIVINDKLINIMIETISIMNVLDNNLVIYIWN